MCEESTTASLVDRARLLAEAMNRRDFDAVESFFAPDAVFRGKEVGRFEGAVAIRVLTEDLVRPYDEFHGESEEIIDLGNGVTFGVSLYRGRTFGSSAEVRFRFASVATWAEGLIEHITNYADIDQARVDAERLAAERD